VGQALQPAETRAVSIAVVLQAADNIVVSRGLRVHAREPYRMSCARAYAGMVLLAAA